MHILGEHVVHTFGEHTVHILVEHVVHTIGEHVVHILECMLAHQKQSQALNNSLSDVMEESNDSTFSCLWLYDPVEPTKGYAAWNGLLDGRNNVLDIYQWQDRNHTFLKITLDDFIEELADRTNMGSVILH